MREAAAATGCARCVLVVDDDHDIREATRFILESAGYSVLTAADGQEALERLRKAGTRPCVVLLDMMMPRMNGWQFCDEQKRDRQLAGIPVVILTGDGRADEKASSLGVAAALAKPIELDALLSTVARHCPTAS